MTITCYVERLRRFYTDGLEQIELFVSDDSSKFVTGPPAGQRLPVTLKVGNGVYTAGLRTYPPNGSVYVCPDLIEVQSGARTSLAKAFDISGVSLDSEITVHVEGETWTVSTVGGIRK